MLVQFHLSEAKDKFYHLFKLVSQGQRVLLENKQTGEKFEIVKVEPIKEDKILMYKKLSKVGLKSMSISDIKKILNTKSNL